MPFSQGWRVGQFKMNQPYSFSAFKSRILLNGTDDFGDALEHYLDVETAKRLQRELAEALLKCQHSESRELQLNMETFPSDPFCQERDILGHLNQVTNSAFRETESNLKTIRARLLDVNRDFQGIKVMVSRQNECWKDDPSMAQYLTVQTLFARKNFDKYYDSRNKSVPLNRKPVVKANYERTQF